MIGRASLLSIELGYLLRRAQSTTRMVRSWGNQQGKSLWKQSERSGLRLFSVHREYIDWQRRSNLQGPCLRLLKVYPEARFLGQLRHVYDTGSKRRVFHREAMRAYSRLVSSPVHNVLLQATQLSWDMTRRPLYKYN